MSDLHNEIIKAEKKAQAVMELLIKRRIKLALAESCTAGLISALLANTSGASSVLWGSFICYTQEAKIQMLDLDKSDLDKNGLVSRETACKMAEGALKKSGGVLAAAVTGYAEGGGNDAPAGTVHAAVASSSGTEHKAFHFTGFRNEVRAKAAAAVLEMLRKYIFNLT